MVRVLSPTWKPPFGTPLNPFHPLTRGLVGCWLFNEGGGSTVYDVSGYGNTATLEGVASPPTADSGWNPGGYGPAVNLDASNDYVSIPDRASFSPANNSITVAAWVCLDTTTYSNGITKGIFSKVNVNYTQYEFRFSVLWWDSEPLIRVQIMELDGSEYLSVAPSSALPLGSWVLATLVFDKEADSLAVYVDNELIATDTTSSGSLGDGTASVMIGATDGGGYSNQLVDSFFIWERALTIVDINNFYEDHFAMFAQPRRVYAVGAAAPPGNPWYAYAQM